jgi:copper chaperone
MNLRLFVPAMSCGHCVRAIERGLRELPGVARVEVRLDKKTVDIDFEPPAEESALRDLLAELGYPVEG